MNTKDRIIQEIETASSDLRKEVLDFILFLKSKENQTNQVEQTEVSQSVSDSEITQTRSPIANYKKLSHETDLKQKCQQSNSNAWDILENMSGTISAPEAWSQNVMK